MNPPFDRERDIDHVLHALKFLKDDGRLKAVMSAGTEFRETRKAVAFRALMENMSAEWEDLPAVLGRRTFFAGAVRSRPLRKVGLGRGRTLFTQLLKSSAACLDCFGKCGSIVIVDAAIGVILP